MSSACPARFRIRHTLAEMGAARLWHLLKTEPFVNTLGALTGNQAVQQVKAGLQGDLSVRLAGRGATPTPRGQMYPDQSLYPVDFGAERGARINAALRRADQIAQPRAAGRHLLDGADRRRCGGRVRRPAERLRADAGDDRGRRRGRAFRGPARVRKEVRPSRRQGAGADQPAHPHAERRAPGRRRRGRADRAAVPHRRALGAVADHRRR